MKTKLLFLVAAVLYFLVSCKKETDNIAPVLSITSPSAMQSVNGFDTLQIIGNISDNRTITSVQISLKKLNGVPVLSTIVKTPNSAHYVLNIFYFFNDIHLVSGEYYFDISASDGVNITHKYISIVYGEVAKIRQGIMIFTNNGSVTSVYKLNNTFNTATLNNTVNGDFIGGFVNSYDQQIVTAGTSTGTLNSLSISGNTVNWSINSSSTIKGFFKSNRNVFISKADGEIRAYDYRGFSTSVYQAYTNYYGETGLIYNTIFASAQHAIAGNSVRLIVYWTASSVIRQQLTLNEDVVHIYSWSNNKLILFTNDLINSTPHIYIYDVNNNSKWAPFITLNSGIIDDCIEISNGVYLVLQNGSISKIDVNTLINTNYMTIAGATKIKYDDVSNELVVVLGNTMNIYNYTTKSLKGSYTHAAPILAVDFLYNK